MKLASERRRFAAVIALALTLAMCPPVWSGGNDDIGPEDHHDDGPSYFGFVKDTSGKIVPDAKVTAEIKGRGSVVTRSDKLGTYKLPGFGKEITPNNVIISCSKDGYKQARILRRTPPGKKPLVAIETECTLQRVSAK
jgi:hypothetical protein